MATHNRPMLYCALTFVATVSAVSDLAKAQQTISTTQANSPVVVNTGRDVVITYVNGVDPKAIKRLEELLDAKDATASAIQQEATFWANKYKELQSSLAKQSTGGNELLDVRALIKDGKLEEAERLLKQVASRQDAAVRDAAATQYDLGNLATLQFKWSDALRYFENAHRMQSNEQVYADAFANAAMHERDCTKAADVWESVLSTYQQRDTMGESDQDASVGRTLNSLGCAYQCRTDYPKAIDAFLGAQRIYQARFSSKPNLAERAADLGWTWNNLGSVYRDNEEFEEAKNAFESALRLYKDLPAKTDGAYKSEVALTLTNLGQIQDRLGSHREAVENLKLALSIFTDLHNQFGVVFESRRAWVSINLATAYHNLGMDKPAEAAFADGLAAYKQLSLLDNSAYLPDVAWAYNSYGDYYASIGSWSAARSNYGSALSIYKQLAATEPKSYRTCMVTTLNNVAIASAKIHSLDDAANSLSEALSLVKALSAEDARAYRSKLAWTLRNSALVADSQSRYEKAADYMQKALDIYLTLDTKPLYAFHSDVAWTYLLQGDINVHLQHQVAAHYCFLKARKLFQELVLHGATDYSTEVEMANTRLQSP